MPKKIHAELPSNKDHTLYMRGWRALQRGLPVPKFLKRTKKVSAQRGVVKRRGSARGTGHYADPLANAKYHDWMSAEDCGHKTTLPASAY